MAAKFISVGFKTLLNLDHITKVDLDHKKNTVVIHTADDRFIGDGGSYIYERELTSNVTVIPAQLDYIRLYYYADSGEVEKLPIIAWAINPTAEEWSTVPVTIDGIASETGEGSYAVLQPDGVVVVRGLATYRSYDDWYKEVSKNKLKIVE